MIVVGKLLSDRKHDGWLKGATFTFKGIRCSAKYNMRLSVVKFLKIDHSRCTVEPLMSKTSEQTKKISEQIFPKFYIIPI